MTTNTPGPWTEHYPEGIEWSAPLDQCPLHHYIQSSATQYGDHPAIDFLDRKTTYAELENLVSRAAKGLQALGASKGTRIGLCLPNTPYSVIFYFATLKVGATVVNFNPLYVEREIAYQIDDSETEIMVTMDLKVIYPKVAAMLTQTQSLKTIVVCPMAQILPPIKGLLFRVLKKKDIAAVRESQAVAYHQLMNNDGRPQAAEIDVDEDIAVLQYTGGTTGQPKGAMLTHGNLTANV